MTVEQLGELSRDKFLKEFALLVYQKRPDEIANLVFKLIRSEWSIGYAHGIRKLELPTKE